jgi:hypothetical protein
MLKQIVQRGLFTQQQRSFATKRYFLLEYQYVEDTYYKRSKLDKTQSCKFLTESSILSRLISLSSSIRQGS